MPKLFVKNTFFFDNDAEKNFALINPLDRNLFDTDQIKIINRYGEHVFDKALYSLVPSGFVALTRQQRKKYHLKKRRCYEVLPHTPIRPCASMTSIFRQKFDYRERIGGADDVFEKIVKNILAARFYPKSFTARTGHPLERGFILHGPKGTGKSFIAKIVGDILNVTPQIFNGVDLLNRPLNKSLEIIRGLFEEAQLDEEKYGAESPLHLIIFDDIDAICRRRSTENYSVHDITHDCIKTQILKEIDERTHLNNLLLIGTTRAIKFVDPALYRSGRLDTLVEVKTPDARGRLEIFKIHTKKLSEHCLMANDVDIEYLIRQTHGMTGADIEKLVQRAIHSAMKRDVQSHGTLHISDEDAKNLQMKNIDFTVALAQLQTQVGKHTAF